MARIVACTDFESIVLFQHQSLGTYTVQIFKTSDFSAEKLACGLELFCFYCYGSGDVVFLISY